MSRFSLLRYDDNLESAETNLLVGWHWIEKEKERKKKKNQARYSAAISNHGFISLQVAVIGDSDMMDVVAWVR